MAHLAVMNWFCILCVVFRAKHAFRTACNDGYFVDENGLCKKCPEQCLFCESAKYCLSCQTGYWGDTCERPCSNCKLETACEKTSGFCLEACRDGYTGVLCDSQCQKKCLSCNRTNADHCLTCANDIFGSSCDRLCSRTCYQKTCDVAKDRCTLRCTKGNWDTTCKEKCPEECSYSCNWQNGTCSESAEDTDQKNPSDTGIENGPIIALAVLGTVSFLVVVVIYRFRNKICDRISKKTGTSKDTAKASEGAERASHCLVGIEERYNDDVSTVPKEIANETETEFPLLQESKAKTVYVDHSHIMPTGDTTKKAEAELYSQQQVHRLKWLSYIRRSTKPGKSKNDKGKKKLRKLLKRLEKKQKIDYTKEFMGIPTEVDKACHERKKKRKFLKYKTGEVSRCDSKRVAVLDGDNRENYISANYIKRIGSEKSDYIACTGPSRDHGCGFALFWKMIWQHDCQVIAMLNTFNETAVPCEQYWPNEGENILYENIRVKCEVEKEKGDYVLRFFELTQNLEMRLVKQLQYTRWPEQGVVDIIQSLLEFRKIVYEANFSKGCPMVVHGSSSVDRTGMFIALDMLLKEVEDIADGVDGTDVNVDISSCVKHLRQQRGKMVETLEQYELLYDALRVSVSKTLEEKG